MLFKLNTFPVVTSIGVLSFRMYNTKMGSSKLITKSNAHEQWLDLV